eukprot:GFUD01004881.1.p1 GENE.GFUD01004881.1~~GFUD01004881.1.p1  ORF type:complete len:175 (+),score=47.85 GFUD01004881.1:107-631(+)
MCDQEKMSEKQRDEKILDFFKNVFKTYDVNNDGTITTAELATILKALGRPSDTESVSNLVRRFDLDRSGKIDWNNGEFLLVIALLDVVDIQQIDDFVYSAGFKTFDQDSDGFITPIELHIVLRLFLPMEAGREDEYVDSLIKKMDINDDGKIGFEEFVRFIKETGSPDILKCGN